MNIEIVKEPFNHLIIKNILDKDSLSLVMNELEYYRKNNLLEAPTDTYSATDENGQFLKKNGSVFIDDIYQDRNKSQTLNANRVIFCKEIQEATQELVYLKNFPSLKQDYTLVSYYEKKDYYKAHYDQAGFTALTHFYKTPKKFTGGNLVFPEFNNYTYEIKHNQTIIFPSVLLHICTEVNVKDKDLDQGYGRWAMSQFLHFV